MPQNHPTIEEDAKQKQFIINSNLSSIVKIPSQYKSKPNIEDKRN